MNDDQRSATKKAGLFSGCGTFIVGWVFAFLLPGVFLFGVRQYLANQERMRQERRHQEIQEFIAKEKPTDMGPATRMLLGIDDPLDAVAKEENANANEQPETP